MFRKTLKFRNDILEKLEHPVCVLKILRDIAKPFGSIFNKKFKGFNNYPNKYEPYYENESEYIKNYNEVQVIENKINEIN